MKYIILMLFMFLQDIARPVSPEDVRQSQYIFYPVPLFRINELLPAPGLVWWPFPNQGYKYDTI